MLSPLLQGPMHRRSGLSTRSRSLPSGSQVGRWASLLFDNVMDGQAPGRKTSIRGSSQIDLRYSLLARSVSREEF